MKKIFTILFMLFAVQVSARSFHYIYTDSLIYVLNADASDTLLIIEINTTLTDNHVFTYNSTTNTVALEAAAGAAGGDAWSDPVDSDILPTGADNTYDLGSAPASFADIFWDGTATGNVTGALTGNASTATALAANGANAGAGNAILGVDASGAAEGAFDVIEPSEINTFAELDAIVANKGLINLADAATITGNWVNTTNPWADNEVSNTLTSSIFIGSGSTTNAIDLATAEVAGVLGDANIPDLEGLSTSLTAGSIVFSDGSNFAQDNANLFWDDTNNRLGIGTATPLDEFHVVGAMELDHTATANDEHGFELDVDAAGFGDIKAIDIDYITGAIAPGEDEAIMLINVDETAATGGDIFGLEFLMTDAGSANRIGIKFGVQIDPLHHDVGSFINPTTATDNTTSTDVPNMLDGSSGTTTSIFEADNEYILIGNVAAFQDIEFVITTPASGAGIAPTFGYSISGAHTFTTFSPVDGTNGFKNTGVVSWDAADLTSHVTNSNTSTFDIIITRTRNSLAVTPILGYAKTAVTTEYKWDLNANLTINSILFEGSTADGFEHTINTIDPTADRTFNFPDDEMVAGDVLVASDASDLEYLNLTTTQILIGDGAGIPTAAALSSGVTMTNAGVVTVIDITITDNESTAEENPVVFVAGADPDGGAHIGLETDGTMTYNPSTGTITATEFVGGGVGITGVTASHAGTITWTGTSILESGAAFQFGDASDATLTHTYANTGTNVTVAYSSALFTFSHGLTLSAGDITQAAGTTLFMGGLLDATGDVDMDYGSADIDDHTFTTDGTGTAEIVLPAGSIDGTEILDNTVAVEDVQPELDNRSISYSIIDTVKAADLFRIHEFNYAITIDSVVTNTDAGTHTFNIEHRAHTTPRSAGTDILTADIVADAYEANSTFDDATIPANRPLYHVGSAVSGGADRCDVTIFYKID